MFLLYIVLNVHNHFDKFFHTIKQGCAVALAHFFAPLPYSSSYTC
jgi:hypothetical protein